MKLHNTALSLAVVAGIGFCAAAALSSEVPAHHGEGNVVDVLSETVPAVSTAAGTMLVPDFSRMVAQYGPAVVNITVSGNRPVGNPGIGQNDPFFQFFGPFGMRPMPQQPMRGEGSGFIVRADGIVLTNAHVVANADQVTVRLIDRREFKAKVLGSDALTDIAVLQIDAADLPVVQLGTARDARVGQWVVAIGSPFGFENSVTQGIVSATTRSLPNDSAVPFIQTDVAVNPGNSGGPLFDTGGKVIGVNSQIYSQSGGYQGISFAIPIDIAMSVAQQILDHGNAEHARLGVLVQTLSQSLAKAFSLNDTDGALISEVQPDSPAEAAGLRSGDVLRAMDGKAIIDSSSFAAVVAMSRPGQHVKLDVWRDHALQSLNATLGDAADNGGGEIASGQPAQEPRLGLAVRPLSPQERQASGLTTGLVVEQAAGAAADAGLRPGDVVLSANNKPVSTVTELRNQVSTSHGTIALLVRRGDNNIFIPVELG